MKSILKIKFTGLDYYTMKKVTFNKKLECDNIIFIDKVIPSIKVNNGKYTLPETILSAKIQADEYLSGQSDFLNSVLHNPNNELYTILDFEILGIENISDDNVKTVVLSTPKKKKITDIEKITNIFDSLETGNDLALTEDFKNNFLHTYQEMKDVLKGMSAYKQISIVLKAMGVGIMSASNAYNTILDIHKSFNNNPTLFIDEK